MANGPEDALCRKPITGTAGCCASAVTGNPAAPPTVAQLRSHLRASLSPQKTPTRWYAVDGYPLTGSGKIQKFAIREAWERGAHSGHELPA